MKIFHSKGFLLGTPINGRNSKNQYDGHRLDELTILATMTCRDDVEDVIDYLKLHKWCFAKTDTELNQDLIPIEKT